MNKIVHLIPALNYGGTERMVYEIAEGQVRHSEVHIVVFSKKKEEIRLNAQTKIHYCQNCFFQRRFIRGNVYDLNEYNNLISSIEPNIIHSHSYFTDIFMLNGYKAEAMLISHWHSKRLILAQSFSLNEALQYVKNWLDRKWYVDLLYKHKVKIICISNHSANYHKKLIPNKLRKYLYTLINSINTRKEPHPPDKCNSEQIRLVSVGRLTKEKNHQFLIKVINDLLSDGRYNFTLDIYGEGNMRGILYNQIKKDKLEEIISLKGNIDNLPEVLPAYDIYLHASSEEQFGLTILEALNAGLPCIALDYGAVNELVIDNKTGFLISDDDIESYTRAIKKLIVEKQLYNELSTRAYEFSLNFTIKEYYKKLEKIYASNV